MLSERLQILVTPEQRRTLEEEARRLGSSVGAVVRDAIDARLGTVDHARRREAFDELVRIGADYRGLRYTPDELDRLLEDARTADVLRGTPA